MSEQDGTYRDRLSRKYRTDHSSADGIFVAYLANQRKMMKSIEVIVDIQDRYAPQYINTADPSEEYPLHLVTPSTRDVARMIEARAALERAMRLRDSLFAADAFLNMANQPLHESQLTTVFQAEKTSSLRQVVRSFTKRISTRFSQHMMPGDKA